MKLNEKLCIVKAYTGRKKKIIEEERNVHIDVER